MRIKIHTTSPLKKKAKRGFRGYPVATIAFYGPDGDLATKVVASIVMDEGEEPSELKRWFADEQDVRHDRGIGNEVMKFVQEHGAKSVVVTESIIGCPHEEGVDYPDGEKCPKCPYWGIRDRWTGEVVQ